MQVDVLVLAPPFLETVASKPDMLDSVTKSVDTIFYSGGSISENAGDAFALKARLFNMHGSTETGVYPTVYPSEKWPSKHWRYIQPHPDSGIEFRALSEDSAISEAVIVRNPSLKNQQPVFTLFPDRNEYPTRDLFAPHPSNSDLWACQGRTDDVIVFKPGYMCNPIIMEQIVAQHTEVRSVLMTGMGRFQPALLVEPAIDRELSAGAKEELAHRMWPLVNEANEKYKIGARVSRTHIVILDPGMTMRYAGKGTVQRGPTVEQYKTVLDDLYTRHGDCAPGNDLALPINSQTNFK